MKDIECRFDESREYSVNGKDCLDRGDFIV